MFMFELLVPPNAAQLQGLGNSKRAFDLQLRPDLMVQAIHELRSLRHWLERDGMRPVG